jgi:REP element-mobilizing transposase RayT
VPHASREAPRNSVFHVTARVVRALPSLRNARIVREIEQTFRRGCSREGFRLVHYSIQRDHVHLIVEAGDTRALGRGVRGLLIRVARSANRVWRRRGAVIAERYHHHRLSSPREVRNAIAYVLNNARKHLGGSRPLTSIDPGSSGRWFWQRATDEPAVARARFWLLSTGWLRAGPLPAPET